MPTQNKKAYYTSNNAKTNHWWKSYIIENTFLHKIPYSDLILLIQSNQTAPTFLTSLISAHQQSKITANNKLWSETLCVKEHSNSYTQICKG